METTLNQSPLNEESKPLPANILAGIQTKAKHANMFCHVYECELLRAKAAELLVSLKNSLYISPELQENQRLSPLQVF